jgi:hypothetical protein
MSWSNISAVTGGIPSAVQPTSLAVSDAGTVYVGGDDGIVYSRAANATVWSPSPALSARAWISSVAVDPSLAGHLFIATLTGASELAPAATSWESLSDGLQFGALHIAIDPTQPKTMFVGANGGVYKTTTAGQ